MKPHIASRNRTAADLSSTPESLSRPTTPARRRAVILLIVVGMLAMLFITLTAFIQIARFDRETLNLATSNDTGVSLQGVISDKVVDQVAAATINSLTHADIPGAPGNEWLASPNPIRMAPGAPPLQRYAIHSNSDDPAWRVAGNGIKGNRQLFAQVSRIDVFEPLFAMHYPSISTLGGSSEAASRGLGLAPIELIRNVGQLGSINEAFNSEDLRANARVPWADADGDGIPDSSPLATMQLTRLAHEVRGKSVAPPPSEQRDFNYEERLSADARERERRRWDRYLESTDFEIAMRIVSNGGHLQLDMGYEHSPMRDFVRGMAGWIFDNDPGDTQGVTAFTGLPGTVDEFWFELANSADAIEQSMRRRGGLRPPAGVLVGDTRPTSLPEAVQQLDQELFDRFGSRLYNLALDETTPDKFEDYSQRFNLADTSSQTGTNSGHDVLVWDAATYLSPDVFNRDPDGDLANDFGRRNLLGAMNYSDDTARQMEPDSESDGNREYGLLDGQLKFYLGHVEYAFDSSGAYKGGNPAQGGDPTGLMIARTLADYYYEMLGGHAEASWHNDEKPTDPFDAGTTEAVSRLDQAYMLAVNTLGAAAPYNDDAGNANQGVIYTPYLTRQVTDSKFRRYYGYVPQLYITQLMAHTKPYEFDPDDPEDYDPADPEDVANPKYDGVTALAIEIYNPHDRELALKQYEFVITLEGETFQVPLTNDSLQYTSHLDSKRIQPRTFATYSIETVITDIGANATTSFGHYNGPVGSYRKTISSEMSGTMATVQLVKATRADLASSSSPGSRYAVDEMRVPVPSPAPIERGSTENDYQDAYTWVTVYRDTSEIAQPFAWFDDLSLFPDNDPYRGSNSPSDAPALWRIATPFTFDPGDLEQPEIGADPESDEVKGAGYKWGEEGGYDAERAASLGVAGPSTSEEWMPATVFYTQNPSNPQNRPEINGVFRPAAYPTVGFLAFVPRFSHSVDGLYASNEQRPMTQVLGDQLRVRSSDQSGVDDQFDADGSISYYGNPSVTELTNIPADFGHMPFFDNQQPVRNNGPLANDHVPWGMLIFDYFTTHDPFLEHRDPTDSREVQVDPYRIPGRININAASWYTLAGLPVIDPERAGFGDAGGAGLSPAFWDRDHGILVGSNSDNSEYRRTIVDDSGVPTDGALLPSFNGSGSMNRLGVNLAQAIEAHRERIQLFDESGLGATGQTASTNPYIGASQRDPNRSPSQANGPIRTGKGFFTLGELLNVRGFDSSEFESNFNSGKVNGNRLAVNGNGGNQPIDPALAGDYYRAISLLALLDSHFVTTRSNTFTAYVSIFDRRNPDDSVRMQMTLDRSNMIRRMQHDSDTGTIFDPAEFNYGEDIFDRRTVSITNEAELRPRVLNEQRIGYFNTRFDQ